MTWANQMQEKDDPGWNDNESEVGQLTLMATTEQSAVSQIRDQLKVLTLDQKSELTSKLGVGEDFPLA
jgi:hypothetical protein